MAVIEHVIVLALENRSFDHMLGFLDHPDPAFDGLARGGPFTNPGWDGGAPVAATSDGKPVLPVDPDHSHDAVLEQLALVGGQPTNQGFVTSYERKGRGLRPVEFGGLLAPLATWWVRRGGASAPAISGRGPLAMRCQPPGHAPALASLARQFAVCTRWFCSVPGETWPNRNFMHAATSSGETDIDTRFYTERTIFELLAEHGHDWRIYHDDTPQVWAFPRLWDTPSQHANWFDYRQFAAHAAAGDLPAYTFIEPNHRPPLHTLDHEPIIGSPDRSDSQHPGNNLVSDAAYDTFDADADTDFARGDALVASVYEALRANPALFERSVLLITYDEHGGLYDHVPPPTDVPSPGGSGPGPLARALHLLLHRQARAFDFTMLGPRVPAVVVSPFVPAGAVLGEVRDHASIPATLRAIFAPQAAPLTARDGWARPFHTALTLDAPRRADLPDLSGLTGAGAAPDTASDARADQPIPRFYQAFARQAEVVWRHLVAVGEPEATAVQAQLGAQRPTQISQVFAAAAQRHRAGQTD
jgi:phospholipase C